MTKNKEKMNGQIDDIHYIAIREMDKIFDVVYRIDNGGNITNKYGELTANQLSKLVNFYDMITDKQYKKAYSYQDKQNLTPHISSVLFNALSALK